jgi:hypothetical protein
MDPGARQSKIDLKEIRALELLLFGVTQVLDERRSVEGVHGVH